DYCGRAGRREHIDVGAGDRPKAQYRRACGPRGPLSDLRGGGKTRRRYLFYAGFDEYPSASHHGMVASSRLIFGVVDLPGLAILPKCQKVPNPEAKSVG